MFLNLNKFFLKHFKLSIDVQIVEEVSPSRFVRHRQQVTYTFIYIEIHLLLIWTTSFSLTFTPRVCKNLFKGQIKK